ncbi:UPF0149 family protein [Rhodanobacter sp. DHB23]|uniref:UPF0149 family protein n=1 Tax=Rhodanobacter sp. DHB23 TaxID=2775923 RepID=UPI001786D95D|nr:UPF0149 family protein [Rhodanobacter sp. DHB23]MBD8872772.1 UPF0149 family protein [Rhodanobacter sp. DHB23]
MPANEPLSHDQLDALIVRLRLGVDASELHGSLCGYLAGGATSDGGRLLTALELEGAEGVTPSPADQVALDALLRQCRDALADPDLGFEPLLPDADRPLDERAEAVVDWCRGFLGGFGLAGTDAHAKLSDDAQEVLRDFGTVAASSFDFGDAAEDEDALIEVQEFLRVGALLLYTESAGRGPSGSDRLH